MKPDYSSYPLIVVNETGYREWYARRVPSMPWRVGSNPRFYGVKTQNNQWYDAYVVFENGPRHEAIVCMIPAEFVGVAND